MLRPMAETAALPRAAIVQRGRRLEYFTIVWNLLEGLIAVAAGALAGSISLLGFGLDSFIEVASGAALLWRMAVDSDVRRRELHEKRAQQAVGICFVALAAYLAYESAADLWLRRVPQHSLPGIALACVSIVVMPILSRAKRKVGAALSSGAMHADARQTDFCAYLSAILLGGLLLNAIVDITWADPLAALVMTPIIAKEGIDALRNKPCPDCHADHKQPAIVVER